MDMSEHELNSAAGPPLNPESKIGCDIPVHFLSPLPTC